MRFKIILSSLCFLPLVSYANDQLNLPVGKPGINIVDSLNIKLPNENKNFLLKRQQIKNRGYADSDTTFPRELLAIGKKKVAFVDSKSTDPEDTNLKRNLSQINIDFNFHGIPNIPNDNVIGYAPAGNWENKKWTGIVQYFNKNEIGTCFYQTYKISSVFIVKEQMKKDINNKPTVITVEGNKQNGFLYNILWFDDTKEKTYQKELECANMKYDKLILEKMIELAKQIDSTETHSS